MHGGHHGALHFRVIGSFAIYHTPDLFFTFGYYDMNMDRSRLAKPPASPNRLIPLFIRERAADERDAGTVLEIEPESANSRLADQPKRASMNES